MNNASMSRRPGAQSCACHWRSRGLIALAAALAMWNLGCNVVNSGGPTGSGRVISDTRTVSRFSAIELRGVGNAVVTFGGPEALTVEAEDNLLPSITTTVSNDTLVLELKTGRPTKPIVYRVTARELTALTTSGAGDIEANGLTASRLRTSQNGAGDIRLGQLTAQEVESSMSGAGSLDASGTVGRLTVTMAGAGKLNGRELAVRDAQFTITGAGDAVVRVSDTLRAQLTGAGSVAYIGNPRVESNVVGAGSIRRIES